MTRKGVSGIIATILLVLITIALVGTAFLYFSGIIGGKTSKTVSLSMASCDGNVMTLVVINEGTVSIQDEDLKILVDNELRTTDFIEAGGDNDYTISPHKEIVLIDNTAGRYTSGQSYTVIVVSPTNSIRQVVSCT